MKISKVNGMTTAIEKEHGGTEGILYNRLKGYPKRKAKIREHIEKRVNSTKGLYRVFNQKSSYLEQLEKQGNKEQAEIIKDVIGNLNQAMKSIIQKISQDSEIDNMQSLHISEANLTVENGEWICKCKPDNAKNKIDWKKEDKKEIVHQIVLYHLRKSLKKNVKRENAEGYWTIPEYIEHLAYALCSGTAKKVETGISEEEMNKLFAILKNDYLKTEQIQQIAKSIQDQNVHVQVAQKDGKKLLQISNADHPRKKYLFEFMKSYAAGNREERRELLLDIRKLILFYIAEIEEFHEIFPVWSWGAYKEDVQIYHPWFSDTVWEMWSRKTELDRNEKTKRREANDQIKEELRRENVKKFNRCIEAARTFDKVQETGENIYEAKTKYWAEFVSKTLEKLILSKTNVREFQMETIYLCDKVWENFLSFVAGKYVNMGKAVYHFAFPDVTQNYENLIIGKVLPQFEDGITSFDYERITAEEDLERELSSYVLFAINNFSRSIASNEEYEKNDKVSDVLQINKVNMVMHPKKANKGQLQLYSDVYRRVMQFFGGQSQWKDTELEQYILTDETGQNVIQFVDAVKEKLTFVRNSSFHYASKNDMDKTCENELIQMLFSQEYEKLGKSYRKKYYSNNVPMFYSRQDINTMMDRMYNRAKPRAAQIPAFNHIVKKKNIVEVMNQIISKDAMKKMTSNADAETVTTLFQNSFMFLLKEIYYYQFLQLPDLMFRFGKSIEIMKNCERTFAIKDFFGRMEQILGVEWKDVKKNRATINMSFGTFCQTIMTDYNLQNQNKEVLSGAEKQEKEKYKHFCMILYKGILEAFLFYLKNDNKMEFLKNPVYRENIYEELSEIQFQAEWKAKTFTDLENMDSELLYSWYVTAHFLNPKQLNHLSGSIRNYIQYIENINSRAVKVGERDASEEYCEKIELYAKIVRILEFVMIYCGQFSNNPSDYFQVNDENDYEDYAEHLSKYVDFITVPELGKAVNLKMFCDTELEVQNEITKIGIYYDALNPIMKRNVIMASMYGQESILAECMKPVTKEEIVTYYTLKKELQDVFARNACKNKKEQEKLKQFQNLKNRIELLDVMTYTEIMNELFGKLISWAYLRERDRMYMQLGFHYIRLYYGGVSENESWQRTLKGDGVNEKISIQDGALLYQIAAMYKHELPVYVLNQDGFAIKSSRGNSIGTSIMAFCEEYCHGDYSVEDSGLCFFEVNKRREEIVAERNAIDHFRYYSKTEKSMMELYTMIYRLFFTYDLKLQKSVSFNLKNILKRYFVIANTKMDYTEQIHMMLSERGLASDKMTYKLEKADGKGTYNVEIDARSPIFLEQLARLLEYKK